MEKKFYTVKAEGWLDGTYRMAGETLRMTEKQAEHLLIVGSIELKPQETPEETPVPAKASRQIAPRETPAAE